MMLAEVERLTTPQVEWSVMLPVLILLGGAVVLMVVGALTPRRPKVPWHAGLTVALALAAIASSVILWWRVRDDGPISAVSDAVVVDGLSLYLGIAILCAVVLAALLTHGRDAATPVAIVQDGSLPGQRAIRATLDRIVAVAEAEGVRAPAVIVVGAVAALGAPSRTDQSPASHTAASPGS